MIPPHYFSSSRPTSCEIEKNPRERRGEKIVKSEVKRRKEGKLLTLFPLRCRCLLPQKREPPINLLEVFAFEDIIDEIKGALFHPSKMARSKSRWKKTGPETFVTLSIQLLLLLLLAAKATTYAEGKKEEKGRKRKGCEKCAEGFAELFLSVIKFVVNFLGKNQLKQKALFCLQNWRISFRPIMPTNILPTFPTKEGSFSF